MLKGSLNIICNFIDFFFIVYQLLKLIEMIKTIEFLFNKINIVHKFFRRCVNAFINWLVIKL